MTPGGTEKANDILRRGLRGMKPVEIMGALGSVCQVRPGGVLQSGRGKYTTVKPKKPRQKGGVDWHYVFSWVIWAGLAIGGLVGAYYVLAWLYPVCEQVDPSTWGHIKGAATGIYEATKSMAGTAAKSVAPYVPEKVAQIAQAWHITDAPDGLLNMSSYADLAKECIRSHLDNNQAAITMMVSYMAFFAKLGSRERIESALRYLFPGKKQDLDKALKGDKKSKKRFDDLRKKMAATRDSDLDALFRKNNPQSLADELGNENWNK